MYRLASLTADQLAQLTAGVRMEIDALRIDSDQFDPELYEAFAQNDADLFELAQAQFRDDGSRRLTSTGKRYKAPGKAAAPEKPDRKPREKRPKKEHPLYTGPAIDRDGMPVAVGDTVEAEIGGKTVLATIINLKRHEGGGHQVKYRGEDGKWKTPMVQPGKIRKAIAEADAPVVEFKEPLPAELVKTAEAADRTDCDENKTILVEPTEKVVIDAPMIADPANGDRILANPDGTAMTVVKGSEVKKHFRRTGKAKVEKQSDGTVEFDTQAAQIIRDATHPNALPLNFGELPGAAEENDKMEQREKRRAAPKSNITPVEDPDEEETARDKTTYTAVKRAKPTPKCEFTREKAKSPALVTLMEGLRLRWHDGESKDKILAIYWLDDSKKIIFKMKVYDWLDLFGEIRYFAVCPARGKLTRIDKPQRGQYKVLFSEAAMKDFYRHPNDSSCRRVARALFVECYRNGACSDEQQKRLYTIFATKCSRQEKAHSREYMKYTHSKASERWKGYSGSKTYPEIYREVLADLRKAKR